MFQVPLELKIEDMNANQKGMQFSDLEFECQELWRHQRSLIFYIFEWAFFINLFLLQQIREKTRKKG